MPKTRIKSHLLKIILAVVALVLVLFFFSKKTADFEFKYSEIADIELPHNYTIHGIDISHHNGDLFWKSIHSVDLFDSVSLKFVFIKATEGKTLKDPKFNHNWRESKKYGLTRGAYHFYIASRDPIKQAENFCRIVQLQKGDLPPVCDFEGQFGVPTKKIKKDLKLFLKYIEDNYQVTPIIYTNPKLFEKIFKDDESFEDYKLWIAHYGNKMIEKHKNLLIWQHNKSGKLPESSKSVDYNVFLGSENDFNSILIK